MTSVGFFFLLVVHLTLLGDSLDGVARHGRGEDRLVNTLSAGAGRSLGGRRHDGIVVQPVDLTVLNVQLFLHVLVQSLREEKKLK